MTSDATAQGAAAAHLSIEEEAVDHQSFGFWLYLMSDLVIFAAIFATFTVLARSYAGGPTGREIFDLPYAFVETMFLLVSSAACGMAMLAVHQGRRDKVLVWLGVTFLLGLGFISMEVHEFHSLVMAGNGPSRSGFLTGFFTLVGTHGLHVTSGLVWMAVMMIQVGVKGLTLPVQSRLLRLSMFWHFLDIVWVAVFTIVYLMGVMR